MSETVTRVPAVEGWFTTPEPGGPDVPHLIGAKCAKCATFVFPPRGDDCPNPACDSTELVATPLSRKGRVWSYTENRYAPPPPFKAPAICASATPQRNECWMTLSPFGLPRRLRIFRRFEEVFQEVYMHLAAVAIPGARPPRFGANV